MHGAKIRADLEGDFSATFRASEVRVCDVRLRGFGLGVGLWFLGFECCVWMLLVR